MRKATAAATKDPYLVLAKGLAKGVYAQSPDMAWEKYRDQLAQLHATTDREDVRQRMAWGAYQDLLRQNHEDMYRSEAAAGALAKDKKPLGAAFSHGRAVAKRKGKAGDKKTAHAAAQRYLTANGHGKMGEDT